MNHKAYPPEKRAKIADMPLGEVQAFISEIPVKVLVDVSRNLPRVDGFRPGQPAHTQQQIKMILRHLKGPAQLKATADAIEALEKLWQAWCNERPGFHEVLTAYDNSADFSNGKPAPPNTPLDVGCIEALVKASHDGKVCREDIKRFYDFGYFQYDSSIETTITKAQSREVVQSLRRSHDLPQKVEGLDRSFNRLEAMSQSTNEAVEMLQGDLADWGDKVGALKKVVESLHQSLHGLASVSDLEAARGRIEKIGKELSACLRRVEAVELEAQSATKKHQELSDSHSKAASEVVELRRRILVCEQESASLVKKVADSERSMLAKVEQEVKALERQMTSARQSGESSEPARSEPFGLHPCVLSPAADTPSVHGSLDKAVLSLGENLSMVGLTVAAALGLSREVVAAALAGQIPMLSGSAAGAVAEIVSSTLGSLHRARLSIPVGLLLGTSLERVIGSIGAEVQKREGLTVLVLEGLNRSAVEAYGDSLVRLVSNRILGLKESIPGLLIVGTVVDGPSSLGITPVLTELGPILNTDVLPWGGAADTSKIAPGSISRKLWQQGTSSGTGVRVDRSQLDECRAFMSGSPSLLWQRGLDLAHKRLSSLPKSGASTSIQSVVCGWLVPRAHACGVPRADFQKAVGDGRLDSASADPRIPKLVSLYWPEAKAKP